MQRSYVSEWKDGTLMPAQYLNLPLDMCECIGVNTHGFEMQKLWCQSLFGYLWSTDLQFFDKLDYMMINSVA